MRKKSPTQKQALHLFCVLLNIGEKQPSVDRVCWAAVADRAPVTLPMTQTRLALGFTRWHSADRKLQVANRFKPQVDTQFETDLGLISENIRPGRGPGPIFGG